MPYYNQSAPFWDFVNNMEEHAASHPWHGGNRNNNNDNSAAHPWEGAYYPWGGPFAHRPRHPPHHRGPPPPPPPHHSDGEESDKEKEPEHDPEEGPSRPRGPDGPHHGGGPGHRGGRCPRGRGPRHHPHGPWHLRHGGRHWPGPWGAWAEALFGEGVAGDRATGRSGATAQRDETFQPDVDVFDMAERFVVHVSLPGAKKEDVGVSWDADRSELTIGGVVYRPGDEEFLKTLALDERRVGAFERKIPLGSPAGPAVVDVEGITARMEDGVLRIEVPKLDSEYVEIKKVDIE